MDLVVLVVFAVFTGAALCTNAAEFSGTSTMVSIGLASGSSGAASVVGNDNPAAAVSDVAPANILTMTKPPKSKVTSAATAIATKGFFVVLGSAVVRPLPIGVGTVCSGVKLPDID